MIALSLVVCYVLGSIPSGYILTKLVKGVDIRTIGSGNVGATNALRTVGPWGGALVLTLDVLKGVVAVLLIPKWLLGTPTPSLSLVCGIAAVVGHVFSCFLRFRGGKGVATTFGVLFAHNLAVGGIVLGVWAVVLALTRYVSLGSIVAALAIPVSQVALHESFAEGIMGAALGILIIVRHRANIQRLLGGVEHRAGSGERH